MGKERIDLAMHWPAGEEVKAARALWDRCPAAHRRYLAALAAEFLSLAESANQGTQVVVVPAGQEAEALKHLRLVK